MVATKRKRPGQEYSEDDKLKHQVRFRDGVARCVERQTHNSLEQQAPEAQRFVLSLADISLRRFPMSETRCERRK